MRPFFIIVNAVAGHRQCTMSATPDATAMSPDLYGKLAEPEQLDAINQHFESADERIEYVSDTGVFERRAQVRAAVASLSQQDKDFYHPRIVQIGGKVERNVRKVTHFEVQQRKPEHVSDLLKQWHFVDKFDTRAEAREYIRTCKEADINAKLSGWQYRAVPVYADA